MTCTLEHPVNWEEEQGRCNSAALPDSTAKQKPIGEFPIQTHTAHSIGVKVSEHVNQLGRYAYDL